MTSNPDWLSSPLPWIGGVVLLFVGFSLVVKPPSLPFPGQPTANPLFEDALRADSAQMIFGDDTLAVAVASSKQERTKGLQGRQKLGPREGLLFVFPRIQPQEFWMKNTSVPLSIAWLNQKGKILEIQHMQPETTNLHRPSQPAAMALEMPQGWFRAQRHQVGQKAHIHFQP